MIQDLDFFAKELKFEMENEGTKDTVNYVKTRGLNISLSKPVVVTRSKKHFWYPAFSHLANGDIIMKIYAVPDGLRAVAGVISWSGDKGSTWSDPVKIGKDYNTDGFILPSGDFMFLPFFLRKLPDGTIGSQCNIIPYGKREVRHEENYVRIEGLPEPPLIIPTEYDQFQEQEYCGYVFCGMVEKLRDGGYITTVYSAAREMTELSATYCVESEDGFNWKYKSKIADGNCGLRCPEGPGEPALCRLEDGRLMCIFRGGCDTDGTPFGQTWSEDEGKTWSKPVPMYNAFSVYPRLAVMKNGMVLLSGGRPGAYLWVNIDGTGKFWRRIDMVAHHNMHHPEEPIEYTYFSSEYFSDTKEFALDERTSGYTDVIVLDEKNILYIYDRLPNGWSPIPEGSSDTISVWIIKATIELDGRGPLTKFENGRADTPLKEWLGTKGVQILESPTCINTIL